MKLEPSHFDIQKLTPDRTLFSIVFKSQFARIISIICSVLLSFSSLAVSQEPDGLKVICHTAMPWVVGNQLVEPLIYVDNDNNFVPCLAHSYEIYRDHMIVNLREGVRFQDGTAFDASSVLMNWKAYQETANPYFTIDLRMGVSNMEALSSHKIKIRFKEDGLIGLMPVYLRSFYLYSPSYFRHSKGIYPPGNQANIWEPGPWGTGPYILKEVLENGETAMLHKNPHYWQQGYPHVEKITIYGAKKVDSLTAHRIMKQGQADLFDAVTPSMFPLMEQSDSISLLVKRPLSSLTTLFNMRKPGSPLCDVRVRKALNLLIDRRTLFKYLAQGRALMTAFIFPLAVEGRTLEPYPFRPDEAKALLDAAGYTAENPLVVTIGYFASEEKLANAIAAMLEEGHVKVLFQKYATRFELYQHVMTYGHKPENPMERETWDLNIVNIGLYTNSVATHFGESFVSEGGYRWILVDPKVDTLFFHAMRQADLRDAEKSLLELESYLYEQYYMMPVYISPTILAVHKRIAGSSFSASGYLLNLKEIVIDESYPKSTR
jgi:ABC-type transport system substrate-binding protein